MTDALVVLADPYKGLPRRIHVGALTYRVVVSNATALPESLLEVYGRCDHGKCVIYLDEALALHDAVNTVQHEVNHAIHHVHHVYGLTDESTEEQFTLQGTNGLIEVLLRNPRYFNWLTKQVRQLRKDASRD